MPGGKSHGGRGPGQHLPHIFQDVAHVAIPLLLCQPLRCYAQVSSCRLRPLVTLRLLAWGAQAEVRGRAGHALWLLWQPGRTEGAGGRGKLLCPSHSCC